MTRTNRKTRWAWLLLAVSVVVALGATRIRLNLTAASAPRGVYWVAPGEPTRGSRVRVCLPETLARLGRARGYLEAGTCPGGAGAVGKRIVALPGDRVELAGASVLVNGRTLAGVRRLTRDSAGRFIPAVAEGSYRVAPGTAWLVSESHPRSWDSRYYGAVALGEETSVLVPLVLFDPDQKPNGVAGR